MNYVIETTDLQQTAIMRALAAYNHVNTPITEFQFVQKLVDGQIGELIKGYVRLDVSSIEFQKRFTQTERIAIRTAAQTNAIVADYLAMTASAPTVTLNDPLTVEGVMALEAAGLLDYVGRAAEILAL